VLCVVLVVKA